VAIATAFVVGGVAALSLRPAAQGTHQPAARAGAPLHWRVPSAYGTNLPGLGDNAIFVSQRVAAASGGSLRLEIFEPGTLVPTFRIVDAVRAGKVPAGYTWLGYDQGWLPASVLFGAVPFGMEPWAYAGWWYEGGGRELAEEIYAGQRIHPLLCGMIGPETAGWFQREIENVDDLRGLKIRFAGLGGKVLQRLGASITMLPGGEIFQALEKGAIDASEFSLPVVDARLGFDRVAAIDYFPGWHQPSTAFHLVVNTEAWQALGASERALIELACTTGALRNLARAEALQGPALKAFEARGVRVRRLPDAILAELRRVSEQVIAEEEERDADFARVRESQRVFVRDDTRWRRLAYLREGERGAP